MNRVADDRRLFQVPKNFDFLSVQPDHCAELSGLPRIHKDPFDRMLIAQARAEDLTFLTRDERIASYGLSGARLLP